MVAASTLSRAASIVKATRKSDSAVVGEYKYDALGRRVEKVVTGATYRYIYSGVETVSVYTSTGTWKQDYVYGPVIDEVIMLEQADVLDADGDSNTSEPARSWYMRNALGSVMLVEEQDRTEAVTYRYDPYGNVTITRGGTGQSGDPLGQHVTYTGRWRDEETGLYHYRARAYDPVRGRFLQRDSLDVMSGANLYEYAASCTMSLADPIGKDAVGGGLSWPAGTPRDQWRYRGKGGGKPGVYLATAELPMAGVSMSLVEDALDALADILLPSRAVVKKALPPRRPWWYDLPPCPPTEDGAKSSSSWCAEGANPFHGDATCYRSVQASGAGQQCCYDSAGKLITEGPNAGTPDRVGTATGRKQDGTCETSAALNVAHTSEDVLPFLSLGSTLYQVGWPPSGSAQEAAQRAAYDRAVSEHNARRR